MLTAPGRSPRDYTSQSHNSKGGKGSEASEGRGAHSVKPPQERCDTSTPMSWCLESPHECAVSWKPCWEPSGLYAALLCVLATQQAGLPSVLPATLLSIESPQGCCSLIEFDRIGRKALSTLETE